MIKNHFIHVIIFQHSLQEKINFTFGISNRQQNKTNNKQIDMKNNINFVYSLFLDSFLFFLLC
jgi:hypothetical protein